MSDIPAPRYSSTHDMEPFVTLVREFSSGAIHANAYELRFLELHRDHPGFFPHGMYPVMQELFYAAEDYVDLDHLRDPGELDADQFRARVTELEPELLARFEDARRREARDAAGGG